MKKIPVILLPVAMALGMMACEGIGIKVDTDLTADLNITVAEPAQKSLTTGYPFYAENTIDPMSDPEVQEYIDDIMGWTVNSITVEVISVSHDELVFMAGTWFSVSDDTDTAEWILSEDFEVVEGAELVLDNSEGDWDTVVTILERNSEFKVSTGGEASMFSVTVVFRLTIDATVKVSAF